MLEKLLEKFLLTYFGKWISGIDDKNLKLGITSGNITINNVSINNDTVNGLGLPIIVKFSFIDKLKLKIPILKLSTHPVELLIENVHVVLGPKPEN